MTPRAGTIAVRSNRTFCLNWFGEMKFSLTPANLAKVIDGELPGAMWEYYIAYCSHVESDSHRETPRFTEKELRAFDLSLPRGLRLVHSFMRFDGDFLNGGIVQYIGNH